MKELKWGIRVHTLLDVVTSDAEAALSEHISQLNAKGRRIPISVAEIAEFPYESFEALKNALNNRSAQLLRFSFDYHGSLIRTLNPTPAWTIDRIITFLLPVLSIALAVLYSWWCLFGILFFFYGLSRTKKRYNDTVFSAAMTNELAFCFLFSIRQVSVSNPDRSVQYYYDLDNSVTASLPP